MRRTLEMIRFSHTLFALPFALLAALMAWSAADEWRWMQLAGIVLCMVFARSAAMAFNRLVDRRLDALNPRTAGRHLPAGTLSVASVTLFAVFCAAGFIASTLLFLPNRLPLVLSIPVLAFLCGYSYAKRFTALAHLWLGTALALAPVAAWIAIRGTVEWPPVVLAAAVALWVAGFDIIYACQDYDVDRRLGLHSIPARLGIAGALRPAAVLHLAMIGMLLVLPVVYPMFGALWYVGIAAIAVLLTYEHWLVRPDDLSRVNTAFFKVNAVISVGLLVLGAVDLWT
ncbi:MAG TPA: UbiA-like polyprenyltransferase [Pirellulales bacterium]|nr:UbiA-like polyprenyltransferase [Pirellulales bacterium]